MKKVYILIFLIMLLFTTYEIANSYAKYTSEASGTASKQAGAWVVEVNDEEITSSSSTKTFQIANLTYPANNYVLENKMAPTSTGYFDIEIDPTGASVAIRYDLTIDFSALSVSNAINFDSAYKVVNNVESATGIVKTGANTYSGIIPLSEVKAGTSTTLRFYVAWTDDGTGTNDDADSALGLSQDVSLALPVSVTVSQYLGETLVPYVAPTPQNPSSGD